MQNCMTVGNFAWQVANLHDNMQTKEMRIVKGKLAWKMANWNSQCVSCTVKTLINEVAQGLKRVQNFTHECSFELVQKLCIFCGSATGSHWFWLSWLSPGLDTQCVDQSCDEAQFCSMPNKWLSIARRLQHLVHTSFECERSNANSCYEVAFNTAKF